jgi:alpha-galactosidase
MKFTLYLTSLFSILSFTLTAQTSLIPIETANNALVLQITSKKDLQTIYYGRRLSDTTEYTLVSAAYRQPGDPSDLFNSAYTPSGSRNLIEPAISVTHADGNYSLDLRFVSRQVTKISDDVSQVAILLKDPVYDFEVTLYYKAYYKEDIIEQWSAIRHREKGNVILHKYASANLHLQAESYWLRQYHGDWAKEMQPEEARLTHGIKTLDSKLGARANLYQPPVFMVSLNKPATEDEGTVLYGGVEWSGNFRVDLEVDPQDNLRILAGINNYASPYTLAPNEVFETPPCWYSLSDKGKGDASRKVQRWAREHKLLDGKGSRLTLLNNWESTYFDFNEARLPINIPAMTTTPA